MTRNRSFARRSRRRGSRRAGRRGASLALLAVSLVVGLGLCELIARLLWPHWTEFYSGRFQAVNWVPGYGRTVTGQPGFDRHFAQNDGDFRVAIRLNSLGFRDPEPASASGGRLWVLGDSFAFGWGVERDQAFGAVAARLAGVPFYNVASPGAVVCDYQAAVARMPKDTHPRAVVLALTMENDIMAYDCPRGRAPEAPTQGWNDDPGGGGYSMVAIKLKLTDRSALYNVLAVSLKRSDAIERAMIALGLVAKPHVDDDLRPDAKAVDSTADELAWLGRQLPAGTPFAVMIVPDRFDLRDAAPDKVGLREAMVAALTARGVDVLDPRAALGAAGFGQVHFRHDGHWTPLAHEIAGQAVAAWLASALAKAETN